MGVFLKYLIIFTKICKMCGIVCALDIQKDSMIKLLLKIPKLYYTKSHFPLELSQRAFNHLWRVCESYEMWCKETKQKKLIKLNLID